MPTNYAGHRHGPVTNVKTMLAFDIETTGLDANRNRVTVVCTQDFCTGKRVAYEFARCDGVEDHEQLVKEMVSAFDAASSLCAFNGIRFDIPFLKTAFSLDAEKVQAWVFKTSDILEFSRLIFSSTFSLDLLCKHNNIKTKSASGLEAVRMAANAEWDRLRDYCADDVRILCDLYQRRMLVHPRTLATFDLADISELGLYLPSKLCSYANSLEASDNTPNEITKSCAGVECEKDKKFKFLQCLDATQAQLEHTKTCVEDLRQMLRSSSIWLSI